MSQVSADASDLRSIGPPVVSVVGEAVLRAEPDEAMVLVTLSTLEGTPGPALQDAVWSRAPPPSWMPGLKGLAGRSHPRTRFGSGRPAKRLLTADARRRPMPRGVGAQLGALVGLAEPEAAQMHRRSGSGGWVAAAAAHEMPIEPGEQVVTATIKVTFALVV